MRTRLLSVLALTAALSGCQDSLVTVQLATDAPKSSITEVQVDLAGVVFLRDDGNTVELKFDKPALYSLTQLTSGTLEPLFENEPLEAGRYTGLRLLYATNQQSFVTEGSSNRDIDTFDESLFAPIDLTIKEDGNDRYTLDYALDLRLSLARNGDEPYVLKPVARAGRDERLASVSGDVPKSLIDTTSCKAGRSLGTGVAVYAFTGKDAVPDDHDSTEPNPVATARVSGSLGVFSYSFSYLPAGNYTLAVTCQGDDENGIGTTATDVTFVRQRNVELGRGETLTRDF